MPTHKGVTITVHTPNGPLPEYKSHTRRTVTTAYIAVPSLDEPSQIPKVPPPPIPKNTFPPSAPPNSFAISISISPDYKPLTDNPQEHLAAYLFLDGKEEEAAAMLTRRRDTWISSRWCAMEDGSIGEKAFMWREVGLETFLGGLALSQEESKAAAARAKSEAAAARAANGGESPRSSGSKKKGRLRRRNDPAPKSPYSSSASSQNGSTPGTDEEEVEMRDTPPRSPSPSDNDDDEESGPPAQIKNTVGQIKLKLYRVLADGAPKYGVFEPKKDEEEDMVGDEDVITEPGSVAKADVSHTTGFAPAQKVDKDLIWSQTVTCLDPLASPWATFIIFYRGERQLRKMGVIQTSPANISPNLDPTSPTSPIAGSRKRHSLGLDEVFKNLKPLPPPSSQSGFVGFRDGAETNGKKKSKKKAKNFDSDHEEKDETNSDIKNKPLSRKSTGGIELTEEEKRIEEGIRKMKLKRTRASTPLPNAEEGTNPQAEPDEASSWEWNQKYNTPPSQTPRNGTDASYLHRRTKSAAGLLQQLVNEGVIDPTSTASPSKRVKRRESGVAANQEGEFL